MGVTGQIDVITFRTTRDDHPYWESLVGLFYGYSSGHIALRLTFDNKLLYDEYVRGNNKIPSKVMVNPKTGAETYEVYVSFWSDGTTASWRGNSMLQTYRHDSEQSAHYSPFTYNEKYTKYLNPIKKICSSSLPGLGNFIFSEIQMPPMIIMHVSRFENFYKTQRSAKEVAVLSSIAQIFVKTYKSWCNSLVIQQNLSFMYADQPQAIAYCAKYVQIAKLRMLLAQRILQKYMFPQQQVSEAQFFEALEPFMTFGYPERDSITLPLIHQSAAAGIELEPVLANIKLIANNPNIYPYNVFTTNCAKTTLNILWQGIQNSQYESIRNNFVLPQYVSYTGLTVTPNVVLYMVENLQRIMYEINSTAIKPVIVPSSTAQIEETASILSFQGIPDDDLSNRYPMCEKIINQFSRIWVN